jgi:hypothetical protein
MRYGKFFEKSIKLPLWTYPDPHKKAGSGSASECKVDTDKEGGRICDTVRYRMFLEEKQGFILLPFACWEGCTLLRLFFFESSSSIAAAHF